MPSKKILAILIVCVGVITSIWLLQNGSKNTASVKNTGGLAVDQSDNTPINTNDDWKKILTNVPQDNTISVLTDQNLATFDETTKTAQLARDFFSQYLLAKKSGTTLTTDEINNIAVNSLSSGSYTKISGAVYVASNLRVNQNTDKNTVQLYRDNVNNLLKIGSTQIKYNPISILNTALKSDNEKELAKLDPIIKINRDFIKNFLTLEVPKDAVSVHLGLLNASSNLLADLEAMRQTVSDPVRGFIGVSQYDTDIPNFASALSKINSYFINKLGSAQ